MAETASSGLETFTAIATQILGKDGFSTDDGLRTLMSQDIWSRGQMADFVASPASTDELSRLVAAADEFAIPFNPRGGGMSYTSGYTPDRPGIGILDFTRMNRVLSVNTDDMYVTVEAGATWKTLYETLKIKGVRTPFWGPLSGISSTIGGGLAQNNAFFGAGTYGPTGESVTSLTIVLQDGTVVRTGTGGNASAIPFFRHYGPDLTGLFIGDSGALGYKAEASFRLIPMPEHEDWASFEFASRDDCARAMAAVAREGIASEVFGFDPNLTRVRLRRASLLADMGTLKNVVSGQKSLIRGLAEGAKIAMAGRGFMADESWSLHLVVEGRSRAGVAEDMARLKRNCIAHRGRETENSIPKIIRANPFTPLNNVLGPGGERWVPVHGIVPLSKGPAVWAEIESALGSMHAEFETHGIETGYLITSLSTTGFLVEPVFLWPEEIFPIHEMTVEQSWLKRAPRHAANPEATAIVEKARKRVIDIFSAHGAAHFQIGRAYPYREGRSPEAFALLEQIKHAIDPEGRINPGALGLGRVRPTNTQAGRS